MEDKNFSDICHKILEDGVVITLKKQQMDGGDWVYNYRVVCYNRIWLLTEINGVFLYLNIERG